MLLKDKLALFGLVIVVVIVTVGVLSPWLSPHDPLQINLGERLREPDIKYLPGTVPSDPLQIYRDETMREPEVKYLLGTDHLGRCILSRIMHGTRVSLQTSFLVLLIIMTIGIFVGVLSGYIGGMLDNLVVSIIDVLLAFPGLVLALAIAGMLGPSITNVMIALAAVHWVGYARIVRGMVMSIKEKEFVLAARSCGTTNVNIIWRHVLPNMISPVIVLATLDMGSIILTISGLSFLGLGAQPPLPEWGAMLNDGRPYLQVAPWLMISPGLAILLTVLSFNLMGDGLRDIFDPRGMRRL
jgi:peptide/nickel transport system permease protein